MKRPAVSRTVALGAAWSASAVAAVGLGFLAVSLVDASASPGTSPVAATTTASTSAGATSSSTSSAPAPAAATGEHATVAGTVYADCTGGSPVLAGAPAAGWWVDDSNKPGQVEFRTATEKLEVHVSCVDGNPFFVVEGPRADDDGGRSSSSSSASSSSAGATSGHDSGDDSSGRGGGGHGSDDSGPDDSSGRGGGGSGSDDD